MLEEQKYSGGLSPRERELAAIGAAIASNCIPCIEYHVPQARKLGLSDSQIREAVGIAEKLRRVPAKKVRETALALLEPEPGADGSHCGCAETKPRQANGDECGCGAAAASRIELADPGDG